VHDRVHVGLAVQADAVHLGFRSLPPAAARAILPAALSLGLSTHADERSEAWQACDYRIHGPVLDTPSKRGWKTPLGVEGLAAAQRESRIPLWGIGGLLPQHAAQLLPLGLGGLCARSSVFAPGETPQHAAAQVKIWLSAVHSASAASDVRRP
jgi:thiamine-phosphate pyrophosphorylase